MPYLSRRHQIGYTKFYHIFNRVDWQKSLFNDHHDYTYFIRLLSVYSGSHDFYIYHWVLMPDHYHLLIKIEEPVGISSVMAGLGRAYVHYYHKKYKTYGHLWQGRFKSQAVQRERSVLSCGRYIERDPVDSAIVSCACEYSYSSAPYYVRGEPDPVTSENPLYRVFGFRLKPRRQRYKIFLCMSDFKEERPFSCFEYPKSRGRLRSCLVGNFGQFI